MRNISRNIKMRKEAIFGLGEKFQNTESLTAARLIEELQKVDPSTKIIVKDRPATQAKLGKYEFTHGYIEDDGYVGKPEEKIEVVIIIS